MLHKIPIFLLIFLSTVILWFILNKEIKENWKIIIVFLITLLISLFYYNYPISLDDIDTSNMEVKIHFTDLPLSQNHYIITKNDKNKLMQHIKKLKVKRSSHFIFSSNNIKNIDWHNNEGTYLRLKLDTTNNKGKILDNEGRAYRFTLEDSMKDYVENLYKNYKKATLSESADVLTYKIKKVKSFSDFIEFNLKIPKQKKNIVLNDLYLIKVKKDNREIKNIFKNKNLDIGNLSKTFRVESNLYKSVNIYLRGLKDGEKFQQIIELEF